MLIDVVVHLLEYGRFSVGDPFIRLGHVHLIVLVQVLMMNAFEAVSAMVDLLMMNIARSVPTLYILRRSEVLRQRWLKSKGLLPFGIFSLVLDIFCTHC